MDPSTFRHETQLFTEQSLTHIEDFLSKIQEPYAKEILPLLDNPRTKPTDISKKISSNPELIKGMIYALHEHFKERAALDEEVWRVDGYKPEHLILLLKIYTSQKKGLPYSPNYYDMSYIQVIRRDFPFKEKEPEGEDHSKDQIFFK